MLCHSARFPRDLIVEGKTSYDENQYAPVLPHTLMHLFEDLLGPKAVTDRLCNVLCMDDSELVGSPRAHFHIAGRDFLRDQAFLMNDTLKRAG